MGELIFNFTMTLPLQPTAFFKKTKRKKNKSSSHETAGNRIEINVKCSRLFTRKEKSKKTVLLLSNLLAIESKKMKETIEAFFKNLFYYLS